MSHVVFDIGATRMRVSYTTPDGIAAVLHAETPELPQEVCEKLLKLIGTYSESPETITGGIAAIVDAAGSIVSSTNQPRWGGYSFAAELTKATGARVQVVNDAEIDALGEALYGAGKGLQSVAYLGIGTGVGTCHVQDGSIVSGTSYGVVRDRIIRLHDGQRLEELIGGNSIRMRYGVLPEALTRDVWDALTPLLAEGIHNAVTEWHPDIVILGGSLVNEVNGFRLEEVRKAFGEMTIRIERAALGDNSGLYGAKALAEIETPAA